MSPSESNTASSTHRAAPSLTQLTGLAARIDAALPQTQCTRCGYPDCASYAQAIASNEAAINQCPPGGEEGVARLAEITSRPITALNPDNGYEGPLTLAVIDENWCIGCTLCIKACPTDAIIGANKRMHTVIAEHCTGCELCIPVCPVDCIELENISAQATGWAAWSPALAQHARERYLLHAARSAHEVASANSIQTTGAGEPMPQDESPEQRIAEKPLDAKQAMIAAAMARARAKRGL